MSEDAAVARVTSPTEDRNPRTGDLDGLDTLELLARLNAEDARVPDAVRAALPELARAVDAAVDRLRAGGRVHYYGAGTPGRLAAADAAELPPTFGVDPGLFVAHSAGGDSALAGPVEGAEDDTGAGARDAEEVGGGDVALGLTASGRTPYVGAALRRAGERGGFTVLVSANPRAELAGSVDVHVLVDTGPEAVAGSTRLKAGTAQKLVLHTFSTAVMVRLGRTYSNLMIGVTPANAKLRGRVLRLLAEASGEPADRCADALAAAGGDTKVALVLLLSGADPAAARDALARAGGQVRAALEELGARDGEPSP